MVDLKNNFVRNIPDSPQYLSRIEQEINILEKLKAVDFLLEVSKICAATKHIPRTIRGSAGSSLLAWALGINDLDPIKWGIPIERFMNELRKDLPDVDLDFPHDERDKVFDILNKMYPGKVGRITNHVIYHEKSALREALRIMGYRKKVPANFKISDIMPQDEQTVYEIASNLQDTVRSLDLHCGGAIIFDTKVPEELIIPGTADRIRYDKREVDKYKLWKVDMLSNRALSQLRDCGIRNPDEVNPADPDVAELLSRGDSFGLTQAESPAFKKILRAIKPKNVRELALCMGLVRPAAAWRGHRAMFVENWEKTRTSHHLVFEDDANSAISALTGVTLEEADSIRKAFSKQDYDGIEKFKRRLDSKPETAALVHDLESFKEFSMCESHAVAYAKITWALAYAKMHDPKSFWHSTLNNAISMYRPWVHIRQAVLSGLRIQEGRSPWIREGDELYNTGHMNRLFEVSASDEYNSLGYWTSRPFLPECRSEVNEFGEFTVSGLVAITRIVKFSNRPTTFVTLGYDNGLYVDVVVSGAYDLKKVNKIKCQGTMNKKYGSEWIEASKLHIIS